MIKTKTLTVELSTEERQKFAEALEVLSKISSSVYFANFSSYRDKFQIGKHIFEAKMLHEVYNFLAEFKIDGVVKFIKVDDGSNDNKDNDYYD